jgi:hypothetical protein
MDEDFKEVLFDQYCKSCKHKNLKENEEPCAECLDNPLNRYTDKPINYEEKTK